MDNLKKIRKINKLTHQDMAEQLKISKAFYWQKKKKKRRLSYLMAIKIAKIFNMKPDEIFYEEYKNKE